MVLLSNVVEVLDRPHDDWDGLLRKQHSARLGQHRLQCSTTVALTAPEPPEGKNFIKRFPALHKKLTPLNTTRFADFSEVIGSGGIGIVWLDTDGLSIEHAQEWHKLLSDEEQQKARRFRYATDRQSYIAAHSLLRQVLASLLGCPPPEVAIGKDLNGKPRLLTSAGTATIHMNLSHTDHRVAVAFSRAAAVGIDIESINRKLTAEICQMFCSKREALEIAELPDALQGKACMELWTLKEALVKATGQGLCPKITDICCARNPPRLRQTGPLPGNPSEWSLYQGLLPDGFVWAVAQHSPSAVITLWSIDPACLSAAPPPDRLVY